MAILANFGVLLAVILVVSSIGNEYSWQTLRPYLLCSESRLKMLTAKLIAVCIFIIAGMVIAVITAVLLGVLFTAIRGFSWDMSFFTMSFLGNQLLTFVRTFYVILPYSLLAFLFTVLGRSMAAGLGFGIGMVLLEPTITALMQMAHGWLAKIPDYLLHANVQVILSLSQSHLTIQTGQTAQLPGAFHAFVTVAIYSLVFIAIAFTLFRKRDVTG
jgi:ABC-2 type transport system permease protein